MLPLLRGLGGEAGSLALWSGSLDFALSLCTSWLGNFAHFQHLCNSVSLSAKSDFLKDAVRTNGDGSLPVSSLLSPFSVHGMLQWEKGC